MTHYDVDYSDLTPQAKHRKAIEDCREYMGDHRYEHVVNEFRKVPPKSVEQLGFYLSLCGVQGYPVRAMHDEIWPYG
jgi:hypothetical protein